MSANKFSFLEQFVLDELNLRGFNKLTPDDQAAMLPQFVVEAERRLGLALVDQINNEAGASALNAMLEKGDVTPEEWFQFWKKTVPQFETLVKQTLAEYVQELQTALAL